MTEQDVDAMVIEMQLVLNRMNKVLSELDMTAVLWYNKAFVEMASELDAYFRCGEFEPDDEPWNKHYEY